MKKVLFAILAFSMVLFHSAAGGQQEGSADADDVVTLTMGSWRTDDVEQMKAVLAEFTKQNPGIKVEFQPTNPPDYNATLRLQLSSGTGPDVMYARSFATGQALYIDGFFKDLSSLGGINQYYDEGTRSPWAMDDGTPFAIPFAAVSHGIYYNKDIFSELNLSAPKDWNDFLMICEKIKEAGYIPVANSLGDEWDIAEVVFMNIAPNFIGGYEGRLAYDKGEKEFNGPEVVALFEAMASLKPYLPAGFEALTYNDSNALFATGRAAMYFDGSWSIGTFKDVDFEWDILPPPAPAGSSKEYVTFHADAGMAINAATEYPAEAAVLLEWFGSPAGAEALAKYLPTGFFPMSNNSVTIEDVHANSFLALNNGRGTDVRWPWPKLLGGEPSGYTLMMNGSIGVINGTMKPEEAANLLKEGLASWYAPAQ